MAITEVYCLNLPPPTIKKKITEHMLVCFISLSCTLSCISRCLGEQICYFEVAGFIIFAEISMV